MDLFLWRTPRIVSLSLGFRLTCKLFQWCGGCLWQYFTAKCSLAIWRVRLTSFFVTRAFVVVHSGNSSIFNFLFLSSGWHKYLKDTAIFGHLAVVRLQSLRDFSRGWRHFPDVCFLVAITVSALTVLWRFERMTLFRLWCVHCLQSGRKYGYPDVNIVRLRSLALWCVVHFFFSLPRLVTLVGYLQLDIARLTSFSVWHVLLSLYA